MVTGNRILDQGGVTLSQIGYWTEFDLIDTGFNILGSPATLEASAVTSNTSGQIMRTLAGVQVTSNEMAAINPFTDRLRPVMCLGDGTRWELGVFVFTDQTDDLAFGVYPVDLTLADQSAILNQPSINTISFAPGDSVAASIATVLATYGIRRSNIPADGIPIGGVGITWPAGTTGLTVIHDLCRLGGYLPGYFDNSGTFIVRAPQPTPDADFDIVSTGGKVKAGTVKRNKRLLSAYNAYMVIDTAPKTGPIFAVAYVNSQLAWSKENRGGQVLPHIRRVQGLTSIEQAQAMADADAAAAGTGFATIDFESTVPDPRHDLFQNVRWDGTIYREVQHSFGLAGGISQSHTIVQGGFTVGSI